MQYSVRSERESKTVNRYEKNSYIRLVNSRIFCSHKILHQIQGLEKIGKYKGIVSGFIIEFREVELTIFLPINEFLKLQNEISKKSFNIKDLSDNQINYYVIPQTIIKTHYRYDVETFLKNTALHSCDGGLNEI